MCECDEPKEPQETDAAVDDDQCEPVRTGSYFGGMSAQDALINLG